MQRSTLHGRASEMTAWQGREERGNLNLLASPPWGRGWTATGAFSSRGGPGEGVTAEQIAN
jgi:hypothetical protein